MYLDGEWSTDVALHVVKLDWRIVKTTLLVKYPYSCMLQLCIYTISYHIWQMPGSRYHKRHVAQGQAAWQML